MQKLLDWIKRKGDHNIVQYSRFGLPGEETDDRPSPTTIHVAPFMEDAKQFRVFGTHSQRAAVISAGVGISAVIFVFLSVFFEFDWVHRTKGVDMSALFGLVMFLALGILIHYYVIRGIKLEQPKFLVPFIIIYGGVLFLEFVTFLVTFNHWLAFNVLNSLTAQPGQFVLLTITCAVIMLCQGGMLFSVVRCRNYLEMKSIHTLEMLVVEKSKQQFPGIRVVYGNEMNGTASVGVASQSVGGGGGGQSFENPVTSSENVSPPPSYEDSTGGGQATPPQRTILQAREDV